jgi:NAD(P)H-flavin reductase
MREPPFVRPELAEIVAVKQETPTIKTFTVRFVDSERQQRFHFLPGKFLMVSIFGYGEMPIGISSSPFKTESIQLTVNRVGNISSAMHRLKKGDRIGLRGPFGKGFPIPRFRKKDIVFVSGGCGMAPLRAVAHAVAAKREEFGSVKLLYGCRSPEHILFERELEQWGRSGFQIMLTVDRPTPSWKGNTGVVTTLFDKIHLNPENSVALVVGPPVMIHFALKELRKRGFQGSQIFASLERLMHCGIGKCAHCNIAGKYVCIDGPVFSGEELSKLPLEEK